VWILPALRLQSLWLTSRVLYHTLPRTAIIPAT
jgi:hypothetical protein